MPRGRKKSVDKPTAVSAEILEIDSKIKELEDSIASLRADRKAAVKRAAIARKAESKKLVDAFMSFLARGSN